MLPSSQFQSFLDYLKFEKRYSVHTIRSYSDDLHQFFLFLGKQYDINRVEDISTTFIRSWMASLKENDIASRTINRKLSTLKSFFKYLLKHGVIKTTPMSGLVTPKMSKRLPIFIKEDVTARIMEAVASGTEDWTSQNTKMLLTLFYSTGMRLSELITLQEKQIDLHKRQIKVLGKGNKERILPLSEAATLMIREYVELKKKEFEEQLPFLLVTEKGKKLYPKYAYNLVKKVLGEEARTLDKKSPHVLRHTFATHLMNNGASLDAVKELLGHSSLASTQIYTHTTIEKLKDVYKKSHPKA